MCLLDAVGYLSVFIVLLEFRTMHRSVALCLLDAVGCIPCMWFTCDPSVTLPFIMHFIRLFGQVDAQIHLILAFVLNYSTPRVKHWYLFWLSSSEKRLLTKWCPFDVSVLFGVTTTPRLRCCYGNGTILRVTLRLRGVIFSFPLISLCKHMHVM